VARDYQLGFSENSPYVFDTGNRERKARTMVAVLDECMPESLDRYDLLNVGGSAGIIDNHLAKHFRTVVGIDINEPAIRHAAGNFRKQNLSF
jgi:2-polyprenyl-3-methyl-5-hydroxy-6-metoxy-1,4-benzoquinol methylase